jgi:putative transposase
MPWKETDAMKERLKFLLEWERRWDAGQGRVNMAELCRAFGISRPCGYKWVRRYQEVDMRPQRVEEQSRRPKNSPLAVSEEVQDVVVQARKQWPRWGPRKLRAWLVEQYPGAVFPSASCIGEILQRRGMTQPRRRRRRGVVALSKPFAGATEPNALWCIDFKGKFRLGDGRYCHVLTLVDAYSRYLLRCEAMEEPNGRAVQRVCDSAFLEYGLPNVLRSDNGPPFASTAAGGLTRLNVWWLRLGVRLERIEPGKPQQNGRQERLHLTLEEVTAPPRRNLSSQQRALDLWRKQYNEVRPHQALGQKPPVRYYEPSTQRYPRTLLEWDPAPWEVACRVDKDGFLRWRQKRLFVSTALDHELVEIRRTDRQDHFEVRFGGIRLGTIDETRLERGLIVSRRRRLHSMSYRREEDG